MPVSLSPAYWVAQHKRIFLNKFKVFRKTREADEFLTMNLSGPLSRFFRKPLGTVIVVCFTVYSPYLWVFLTKDGRALIDLWHILPGIPSVLFVYLGVPHQICERVGIPLFAGLVQIIVALLLRRFPGHLPQISGGALTYSLLSSFLAYELTLA
jgi:hypothetical protein